MTYTDAEVEALKPYRKVVEARGARPDLRDVFLCHAWDDRRQSAMELHTLLVAEGVSVWFSEKDIILGTPFMREIDRGLARTRVGLVLITAAFLQRVERGGVSDKELSELLSRDQLIPVAHGVTYDEVREVSPLLGSRHGMDTADDTLEQIAKKIAEMVAVEDGVETE
ncbi:toll/interleukin-1 receptor domain-containing protein [Brachybacterium massiliense]|uniref:toll/interleukin-1 receptor domain-containing protein n=1 Tax=Brachybacterium massiliense TaxID=1755098 RepID=UPI001FEAA39B|nr:toll/interleukin-1 receptor domain-containing protein [Brachybacterium massiliense]